MMYSRSMYYWLASKKLPTLRARTNIITLSKRSYQRVPAVLRYFKLLGSLLIDRGDFEDENDRHNGTRVRVVLWLDLQEVSCTSSYVVCSY